MSSHPSKTFTVEQANACLPVLTQLLADLAGVRDELVAHAPELESVLAHVKGNGGSKAASDYLLLLQRFSALQAAIADIGCELKDLDTGLVDFPSYRDGQLVYLCWKRGEPRVGFWHSLDSGFPGRQPL